MRHYLLLAAIALGVCQAAAAQQPGGSEKLDLKQRLQRLEQRLDQLAQQLDQVRQKQPQPGPSPMGAGTPGIGPMGGGSPGGPPGIGPMGTLPMGGSGFAGGSGFGSKKSGPGPKAGGPGANPMGAGGARFPGAGGGDGSGPAVHIYHLKKANARDMAAMLREIFDERRLNLGVDVRTNSLVVVGDLHTVIESIINRLDAMEDAHPAPPAGEKGKKRFFDPDKKPAPFFPDKKPPSRDGENKKDGEEAALDRLRANIAQARAALEIAAQRADRAEELARQGAVSEAQLVSERTSLQAARAALLRAEAELRGVEKK